MSANVPYAKTRQAMLDHAAGDTSVPLTPTMNRVLSAAQHAAALTAENSGASMDLRTLHAYEPGDPYSMVGGEPDARTGKAFPTQQVDYGAQSPKATAGDIIDARKKMLPAGGNNPDSVLGTWVATHDANDKPLPVGERRVDIDLSTKFGSVPEADDAMLSRNEDAHFSMADFSERFNDQVRSERGMGPRPPKGPGQNEIVRRHKG